MKSKSTRKSKRRRRKSKSRFSSVLQALIIEGLAVAAILFSFFAMRADLNSQNQKQWDRTEQYPAEVAQQQRLGDWSEVGADWTGRF